MEDSREDIWKMAFMDTYEGNLNTALSKLKTEAVSAIVASNEYNYPAFREPLLAAISREEVLEFSPSEDFSRVTLFINMEKVAGNIQDYANAVSEARTVMKAKPAKDESDAAVWAQLYDAARTGTGRTVRRGQGAGQAHKKLLYTRTIAVRMSFLEQNAPAPFWYLLEHGNAGTMGGDASFAHPAVAPTRFVDNAQESIEHLFNDVYTNKLRVITQRFLDESVDVNELYDNVINIVTEAAAEEELVPGTILQEIEEAGRTYKIYVTKTGAVGKALRPRIDGTYVY